MTPSLSCTDDGYNRAHLPAAGRAAIGKILLDQLQPADTSGADLGRALEDAYAKTLY